MVLIIMYIQNINLQKKKKESLQILWLLEKLVLENQHGFIVL
jgi:hypothetical protein